MVKINGKDINTAGKSLLECLISINFDPKRVAVECNGDIVPKAQYDTFILKDGDCLEIVSFVGGG